MFFWEGEEELIMRELTAKECETVLVVTITPRDVEGNLDFSGCKFFRYHNR